MILTIDECKKLLGIAESTNTYDASIEAMLPAIEEEMFARLNTCFENYDVVAEAASTVFKKSDNTIKVPNEDLAGEFFHNDCVIKVVNSLINDGIYRVKTIATDTFTLDDLENIIDETTENTCYVYKCDIPKGVNLLLAKMVGHNLELSGEKERLLESEKVGDYSMKYASTDKESAPSYSKDIEALFKTFQKASFVKSY